MRKLNHELKNAAVFLMAAFLLTGCESLGLDTQLGGNANTVVINDMVNEDDDYSSMTAGEIILNEDLITAKGSGMLVNGSTVTITSGGDYNISGTLNDGQIVIDAGKKDKVRLILNGVNIHCETSACILVKKADKCVIKLAEGSTNYLSDGTSYTYSDVTVKEPNAVIFANSDLKLSGEGSMYISAIFAHAIRSKNDIAVTGGNWTIEAATDAVKAKNSIVITGGVITATAGNDGLQVAGDETDKTKGYFSMTGGSVIVTSTQDGIQAATDVMVSGGTLDIITGGGSTSDSSSKGWGLWGKSGDTSSAKGIKAAGNIAITGGVFIMDTSDDSIHTNGAVSISGASLEISSGDDGIHADSSLTIDSGTVDVIKSYEGLEALSITINGGDIRVVSTDDGMNAAGGSDTSTSGRFGGQNPFAKTEGAAITINGGDIYVNAAGDGIDSNNDLLINGGNIMVDGPTNDGNGALDHNGSAVITGGTIVASGSSGMLENFDSDSTQNVLTVFFTSTLAAKSEVSVKDSQGNEVIAYQTDKQSKCAIISCPEIRQGETYTVYVNGEKNCSIESTGVISSNGSSDGGFGPGGFGPGRFGPGAEGSGGFDPRNGEGQGGPGGFGPGSGEDQGGPGGFERGSGENQGEQ